MNNFSKIFILIIIISILLGSFFIYKYINSNNKNNYNINTTYSKIIGASGKPISLTMPLGPSSKINVSIKTYITSIYNNNTNTTTLNTTATLIVNSYKWPFIISDISIQGNVSKNQSLPIFILEIPREYLGKRHIDVPISLSFAREGLCVNLSLIKSNNTAYIYSSDFSLFNYNININISIDKNGIIRKSIYTIIYKNSNNNLNITSLFIIKNYTISNSINVEVPGNWSCNPPLSSHLWFSWEGIYKVNGCRIESVNVGALQSAIEGKSIVIFLNKGCPHCIRTWPNITIVLSNICDKINIPIYFVIIGGFMNKTLYTYLQNTMTQGGLTGYPAFAYYENGFVRDKMLGERSVDQILAFLEKYETKSG